MARSNDPANIQVIGDTINLDGEPVGRITIRTGTLRDKLVDVLHGDVEIQQPDLIESIRKEAKVKAQAGAITLDELEDIFDIVQPKA